MLTATIGVVGRIYRTEIVFLKGIDISANDARDKVAVCCC